MPGSASLEAAFRKAAELIARREDQEHQIHSNPQLSMGPLIRKKLEELPAGNADPNGSAYTVSR